ncbi:hypothetical protein GY45DRAFT_1316059 [Cubamyces sp. BRFM 1775]|nr:hypothetical protein GY45DRAFT_1316059 [Cubamyces sp. BRFM 1775]
MSNASQYGDLATQLLTESRRSTATNTLLKYNDVLVRAIVREQRDLDARLESALARSAPDDDGDGDILTEEEREELKNRWMPTILLYQTAILRNKRCLLAYHHHRLELLKDLYWSVGGALPLLLALPPAAAKVAAGAQAAASAAVAGGAAAAAPQDVRSKLSPHEVDFLRSYADSLRILREEAFSSAAGAAAGEGITEDIDLLAPISHPPKDLQVHVRVVRDCGVVYTELGAIDFRRGHRFLVRRADIEHLIVQGYLEEL